MKKYFRIAWRNMWRNWRRTFIASVAIILGLVLLISMLSLFEGSDQAMFGNAVRYYGGNVSIHASGFSAKASQLPLLPLADPDQVAKTALEQKNVLAVFRRIKTSGMISASGATAAVGIIGVKPSDEESSSIIAENIIQGRYLVDDDENAILISKTLAEYLNVQVGDRVSLLGQRKDESMRLHSMSVMGVYSLGVPDIEKRVNLYESDADSNTL